MTKAKKVKVKQRRAKLLVNGVVVVSQPVKIEKRGNVTHFDFT